VSIVMRVPFVSDRSRAIQAARHRTPLPETSAELPSELSKWLTAPAAVSRTNITPSAPTPRWRSHSRRASAGRSAPAGNRSSTAIRKSLPYAWALMSLSRRMTLFRAKRQEVPAVRPDPGARQRVERADKRAVVQRAFPSLVQPRVDREPLKDQLHPAEFG